MAFKKIITLVTVLSFVNLIPVNKASAQEICTSTGGNGYVQCCKAPPIGAAVTLGAVALGGIIVIALQKSRGGTSHSHSSHSSSSSSVSD